MKELGSKLEEYSLPSSDDVANIIMKDPRDFEKQINEAIQKVPGKADRTEIIGQIKLYRYIANF